MISDILLYAFIIIVVDAIYLSQIASPFGAMIKKIQGAEMKMLVLPAVVVYLSLIGAWYVFIYDKIDSRSYSENLKRAALLGFFIYSVYDFTNLALIKDYRVDLAIIDSLWGASLFAITTALYLGIKKFARML